jgi:tRNA (cytidine/uridine-2'-O-)-methyltransferase
MIRVVFFEPEIPPNTGNAIRLCANAGAELHLIRPLGFDVDDRQLKRAGLDYHEYARLQIHDDWHDFLETVQLNPARLFAFTTKATSLYTEIQYAPGDTFVFGPETRGLSASFLEKIPNGQRLRIPMQPHNRSLNLSNAAAVAVYEAWRQLGFNGQAR